MAVRKVSDNAGARKAIIDHLTQEWEGTIFADVRGGPENAAAIVVDWFPFVQYETATSKVAGESITMRRIVLTGPWEVVRD